MYQIRLAVRQLVEFLLRTGDIDSRFTGFDRALEGARIHRKLQKEAGENYEAEVFLSESFVEQDIGFTLEGRADGIYPDDDGIIVIDEIKTTTVPAELIHEDMNPCHWAQGMLYAAIYALQKSLPEIRVRLTYYQADDGTILRFVRGFSCDELQQFRQKLLHDYYPWARREQSWQEERTADLTALRFPFAEYRPGQRALAGEVYRACRAGFHAEDDRPPRLFCQAPTGIGKTISVIFPALHVLQDCAGGKLFYLTVRNTAQSAAEKAMHLLHEKSEALHLRSITLTAKEKVCLCKNAQEQPECLPERCPYARGYFARVRQAMEAVLDSPARELTRAELADTAELFQVCPFELGLDLSEWCDVVIGDCNYLFDPTVRLRRFFESAGDWLFLMDEAHNLPDRIRGMFTSSFSKSDLTAAKRLLGKQKTKLKTALASADKAWLAVRRACEQKLTPSGTDPNSAAEIASDEGLPALDVRMQQGSTLFCEKPPEALLRALNGVCAPLQLWLEENPEHEARAELLQLFFSVRDFLRAAERYDSHYVTQLTVSGSDLHVTLLCLDPSAEADRALSIGRAAVFFSATLSPPNYYRCLLGSESARAVALPSPFAQSRLGLYCLSGISTRYKDREASIRPISDTLAAMTSEKTGNYLAFFPSYTYLKQVWEDFSQRYPTIRTAVQESDWGDAERADFLRQFEPSPGSTLLGFGVLGGVFGEGIDLVGDRLIGCAVIGVGLPQVNPRQEILRDYFETKSSAGFDYAYRFPGMNKVLQAAGRVIRTEEDRGIVLLIDDRFALAEYRRLFPPHWSHIRTLRRSDELSGALRAFWAEPPLT